MAPLSLAAAEYGAGPPLAILHGLFGSGRNWASIAKRLGEHHRVIAFDLRNHGASPWAETMDYGEMADDVRASLAALGHRRFALLGHSMGGKVAMVAALRDARAVERLVVADIAPVAYQPRHLGIVRGDARPRPRRRAAPGRSRCASRGGGAGPGGARLPAAEPGLRGRRGAMADQSRSDRARDADPRRLSADTAGDDL